MVVVVYLCIQMCRRYNKPITIPSRLEAEAFLISFDCARPLRMRAFSRRVYRTQRWTERARIAWCRCAAVNQQVTCKASCPTSHHLLLIRRSTVAAAAPRYFQWARTAFWLFFAPHAVLLTLHLLSFGHVVAPIREIYENFSLAIFRFI